MDLKEKTVSEKTVYSGKIINVRMDQAEMPDGKIVEREVVEHPGGVGIAMEDEEGKFFLVTQWRYAQRTETIEYPAGVHPTAVIDSSVTIPTSCHIGAHVVIEAGVTIGEGTVLLPNVYVGQEARIGAKCLIYTNVTIRERCILGNRVILHAGVVIGADGFGYKSSPAGHEKIPQVGIVQLDDDVEVGANSTIDRARFGRTWVQAGTKIDNLVQVAHNVEVGRSCILVAQCGIAGSTHLGNGVIMAGQSGVVGHVRIGDGTIVMAQSGVSKDAMPGSVLMGMPAQDRKAFARERLLLKKLEAMEADLKALIKKAKE